MLGKNLSFGLAFCADRAYLLQRKNPQKINGEFLLTPFNFCTARRGCNVAPARSSLRKMPGNCDFMPLLDALRIKTGRLAIRAIKENQWVRCFNEIATREKWRICWVFSRARRGNNNDFRIRVCKNSIIIMGLTATRPGRPIAEKGAVIGISSAKRLFYGARTVSKPGVVEALFRGSVNFRFRDEFARDCPLQRGVCCEPDSLDRMPNISCRHQFTRVPKARNRRGPVAAKRRRRERSHPAPELSMKQPP